jgi:hypothetical protein
MSYFYLATPYSRYPLGIEEAFRMACRQAALLIEAKIFVYCPISHTHPIAIHGDIDPLSHEIWMMVDEPLMASASGLIVCMMEGWRESFGAQKEIEYFTKAGKSIIYMEPGIIPTLPTTPCHRNSHD